MAPGPHPAHCWSNLATPIHLRISAAAFLPYNCRVERLQEKPYGLQKRKYVLPGPPQVRFVDPWATLQGPVTRVVLAS